MTETEKKQEKGFLEWVFDLDQISLDLREEICRRHVKDLKESFKRITGEVSDDHDCKASEDDGCSYPQFHKEEV